MMNTNTLDDYSKVEHDICDFTQKSWYICTAYLFFVIMYIHIKVRVVFVYTPDTFFSAIMYLCV